MKRSITSAVTITDPLVKYQSLLTTGRCSPDPSQHRLAIHLQKVYQRLKDYSPSVEYHTRLRAVVNALNEAKKDQPGPTLADESHPIRRNPLFAPFFAQSESKSKNDLALTRVLASHEEAISIDSPQGLFLSGEVGTGKSMLLDLLANGLPTSRKKRWHFNTFMLYTLARLENHRKMHHRLKGDEQHYSLLWMAKEMIDTSPILFLDEFQLPDRAASKILSNLFIAFFQLGGVLVASSNRVPEELEKATGYQYVAPSSGGLFSQVLGIRKSQRRGGPFESSSDFSSFLEVLKARCEFWQMEGGTDWRRREAGEMGTSSNVTPAPGGSLPVDPSSDEGASHEVPAEIIPSTAAAASLPSHYFLMDAVGEGSWARVLHATTNFSIDERIPWETCNMTVYGRNVIIPQQHSGVVHWDFKDLVSSFGPADYITMASNFHTFIVDAVPVLTILKKNEARRLITLLDALYEARCKLVVRAEVGPDDLFFPEAKEVFTRDSEARASEKVVDGDAIHSETIAEAYQDQMSPFRPNISSYTGSQNTEYDPDQDSDFKIEQRSKVDFSNTSAFTGEDERFAYKRAASRLWELCGPVAKPQCWEARESRDQSGDVRMGPSVELEEPAGLQRLRVDSLRQAAAKGTGDREI
ncbi:AFG1-like ATPase-domain-containing protein [Xylariomycetidae sp. FL2044]|nr:AFG1-like ATPase-domain-containing protein [Xylariomycetidae sp. FL2044]